MSEVPNLIVQPRLQMSAATAAKIAAGFAYQAGGVVREVGTERLVELLRDAPEVERAAEEVTRTLTTAGLPSLGLSKLEAPKLDSKAALATGGVLLVAGVAVGGYKWLAARREGSAAQEQIETVLHEVEADDAHEEPDCLGQLRASLADYVDAGRAGNLTPAEIEALIAGLDTVQEYAEHGHSIVFTLDELLPFFEVITSHTLVLATAYGVTLNEAESASEGPVVSLRRHLSVQQDILSGAA